MADDAARLDSRQPPQNLDAERGILGSILLLNEALDEVGDSLQPHHFHLEAHKQIYSAIRDLYESGIKGVDPVTLAEELQRRKLLEQVGGTGYLLQILETAPHAAHARYYADIVRDKWVQRSLIFACTDILKLSYEGQKSTMETLQEAERKIFQILENQDSAEKINIKDILFEAFDRINERMASDRTISGLSTGFDDLDGTTSGFQPAELIILAARPSMGKTAFVCNIAEAVATRENRGVLIFSLEQSKLELAERFLCIHSEINGHHLRQGDLTDDEHDRLMKGSSELSRIPLFIDDQAGRTMGQVGAIARRMKRKNDLGLIIVDYLQLLEPDDKGMPREQQIAQITRRLKALAKEIEVPVIALAQLNRGVELREDKRPRLADLRESGAIEQDADLVMFLHRPDAYDPEDRPGEAEVIVAKHRSGPTGIVRLTWRKEFMRFENFSALSEPDDGYFANTGSSF